MPHETSHTLEQVQAAIKGTSGIKRIIAERLGVHRNTIDSYLRRWAAARAVYDEEVENVGDVAESVIITAIQGKDTEAAKWYLRMKCKSRGYVERQEVTGAEGGPISIREVVVERERPQGAADE